jgi:hypothetical protein
MTYSSSLRTIGQSLETIRIEVFTLTQRNGSHVVRSESLTPTCRWILQNRLVGSIRSSTTNDMTVDFRGGDGWLSYDPMVISRLQDQGQQKRGTERFGHIRHMNLSKLLRALGEQLDIIHATTFSIDCSPHSVYVEYHTIDGQGGRKIFATETLHQLSLRAVSQRRIDKTGGDL